MIGDREMSRLTATANMLALCAEQMAAHILQQCVTDEVSVCPTADEVERLATSLRAQLAALRDRQALPMRRVGQ
jgi:hypothetical protein